jgi:hypothetical protein
MNKSLWLTGCATLLTTVALAGPPKASWTTLFNGKDLKGWKQLGGQAKYEVRNGEIIGTTVANTPNSFMVTEKEYGDFILEVELLADNSMNSGIQFRSLSKPDYQNGRVHGYQVEVDPSDRAWSGGIYDEARRDWLYIPNQNEAGKRAFKRGEWNKYRVEAIGSTIRTWVNGVPVAYLVDDLTPRGFIALQVHSIGKNDQPGKQIRWRNVRIQTDNLTPSPTDNTPVVNLVPNTLSPQEKAQGFKLLFDGKTTAGWQPIFDPNAPLRRWEVRDGTLSVLKSDGSETGNDIVYERQVGPAFEYSFEFKFSEGGNSGVKYFVDKKYSPGGKSGIGLEFQVLDDEKHPDAKMGRDGNRTLGSLYDLITSKKVDKRFQKKIGDWNQGKIIVYPDNRVEHWLNGFKVVEYVRGSPEFLALVAQSKYKNWEGFGQARQGYLLLQDHGDAASYRSLKLRELK